ncbi:MAG: ATP-binding protein [Desulfovibrio sp.]|jgi:predicted AAA+ superfamily ATPase|nr:ATP-binding protein [Desulfovibrio sp.]
MNKRNIYSKLVESLADTPVVFLRGARQTGKTTLVKQLCAEPAQSASPVLHQRQFISLDSATALAGALDDPTGFLRGLDKPVVIDEAQRARGLMLAIKEDVDSRRDAGRYLLTGSANILTLPGIADSLAGRMEVLTLYPLSQGEIAGTRDDFIDALFQQTFPCSGRTAELPKAALFAAMTLGGYPEVISRSSAKRRAAWFDSYITTLVERDIRDIANIQDRSALIRLLRLLGVRSGTLHNQAETARSAGLPNSTLARYLPLLEALFLVWFLPAWSSNMGKRLVKSPKVHICDSGLACHLCGADTERLGKNPILAGRLLESFVAGELQKQSSWTDHPVTLYHYRSQSGDEVDMVMEDRAGRICAVEVKMAASVGAHDIKGLAALRDSLDDQFIRGVVAYTGQEVIPLGDRIFAVPIRMMFGG